MVQAQVCSGFAMTRCDNKDLKCMSESERSRHALRSVEEMERPSHVLNETPLQGNFKLTFT
ncbi:hypothetical protein DXT90_17520 [Agrobacterium tumefaciens]|nr:hypothetical protein [Agrobacterium tumefaciens]